MERDGTRDQEKPRFHGSRLRMGPTLLQPVPTRRVTRRRPRSVADSGLGDAEDRLGFRQIRRVDEAGDPLAAFRLPQVHTERRTVAYDVAADRPGRITEEGVGF